jgi:hypothetical protein
LFPNDGDGNAWGDTHVGLPPALEKRGYKLVDPGRYQNLSDDFSAQIAAFKKAKLRDHYRCRDPTRLYDLLVSIVAAGL